MATSRLYKNGHEIFDDHADTFLITTTATAVVSGLARFVGFYVSSAGEGANTLSVYDGSSSNGTVLCLNIPLSAGVSHVMPAPARCTTGIFCDPDGASLTGVSVTLYYLKDHKPGE